MSCLEEFRDYIKHIDLSYNNISDSGAEALSKILPRLINLESLNLSSNQIGSAGGVLIAEGIRELS